MGKGRTRRVSAFPRDQARLSRCRHGFPVVITDIWILPPRTGHSERAPIRVETVTAAADTGVPLALPGQATLVRTKLGHAVSHTGGLDHLPLL